MKSKPIFLIMTDSVALPRGVRDSQVFWEETYIHKLKKHYSQYEVISVSIGGASIKDLRSQFKYYSCLRPKLVLIQCGIVDAFPRAFGKIELEIIKKARLLRFTKPFVAGLRKIRQHHYADPREFERCLKELNDVFQPKSFYSLSILPANKEYESKANGVTENINLYNAILSEHSLSIDLSNIPEEGIMPDHHHINSLGHSFIFSEIVKSIKH